LSLWPQSLRSLESGCASYEKLEARNSLSDKEAANGIFCIGYIRGVLDTMLTWKAIEEKAKLKPAPAAHPCIPETVPNEEAIKVTIKFLKDHPEQLHLPASILVFRAMRQAFPCS
jgi:Rap1a immunity proteins